MLNYIEAIETCDKLLDKNFKYKNIDSVYTDLEQIKSTLKDCRNELCLQCGRYKDLARKGFDYCRDCRWRND